MKKYKTIFRISLFVVSSAILLIFLFLYILFIGDDNEFHIKEIRHLETLGKKVGNYYLENKKLPHDLKEISISEDYPYPPVKLLDRVDFKSAGDYRIFYHPIDEKNFTLVMANKQRYIIYYYSSDWEPSEDSELVRQARFLYNPVPYKSEQFLRNRQDPPFNQASSWPNIEN